jgi:hypothetical protein
MTRSHGMWASPSSQWLPFPCLWPRSSLAVARSERVRLLTDVGLLLIGSLMLLVGLRASIPSGHPIYGVDVGWLVQEGANELCGSG